MDSPSDLIDDIISTRRMHGTMPREELFQDEEEGATESSSSLPHRQRQRLPSYASNSEVSESHDLALMLLPSVSVDGFHGDGEDAEDDYDGGDDLPQKIMARQESMRQNSMRRDHLRNLLRKKKIMRRYLKSTLEASSANVNNEDSNSGELGDVVTPLPTPLLRGKSSGWSALSSWTTSMRETSELFSSPEALQQERERQQKMRQERETFVKKYHMDTVEFPIEVRINALTYRVPVPPGSNKIPTVYNSSQIYHAYKFLKRLWSGTSKPLPGQKTVLKDINLVMKPGKMYLILGPPASGKTSLLKAISGRLPEEKGTVIEGSVCYNGLTLRDQSEFHIENAVAYIDQNDKHAPRLTVDETLEFSFQCKTGGVQHWMSAEEAKEVLKSAEAERFHVNLVLEALGLVGVKDTFVGDENVRGVSGGQRRRVTVGEMLMDRTPILCGDEISTGLDATSTYEMIELINHFGRIQKMSRVIALLQPSPETVSLFDEVIVIAEGEILFAGPVDSVGDYFSKLGYRPPGHMDIADFLQLLSTPDAAVLFDAPPEVKPFRTTPYSASELAEMFRQSSYAAAVNDAMKAPYEYVWKSEEGSVHGGKVTFLSQWHAVKNKYANSFLRASWLNLMRNLTIWRRDRRVLIANFVKNAIMGISVGGVFFQTTDVVSILGVLFQGMLFIMLGAMTVAPALVDDRIIFRKQADANFFPAGPFVIGRTLSQMPQMLMDIMVFGTILYWMVGLDATLERFVTFLCILFTFSVLMNQMLSTFSSVASTKATVQVMCACLLLFLILFGGFIVPPNVIPEYYRWIYWWNPFAWAYRALLVNEFQSGSYSDGDAILTEMGFLYGPDRDKVFGQEWVRYSFFYMVPHFVLCLLLTAVGLSYGRRSPSGTSAKIENKSDTASSELQESIEDKRSRAVEIPFKRVTITFEDICYDVKASTGKDQLRLLNNVNGIFRDGRMTALMGSSGAGKTTLMDVIAMRKTSGQINGKVLLNGHPQEARSFRRTSGYVEQFDIQTPELTVKETLLFSARLRINSKQIKSDRKKVKFVNQVIKTLELENFADSLVGSDEEGGLSFEQKKRVSIAVELAASPSVIFLDEPTSGLDARSALLVVKLLRKIADEGRTICCTIHQPSSAVFELFDDLLLLKPGGSVVYFGELGLNSQNLVKYMEARGAHAIDLGENPANWVLNVLSSDSCNGDLAELYTNSDLFAELKDQLAQWKSNPDPEALLSFDSEFACPARTRQHLANQRLATIYWRSPTYNLSRMAVSLVISFVLGSVFISSRSEESFTESEMRAKFAVIFLSFIIVGILAIISVLPVMTRVRDMYYRHRAAGVVDSFSMAWALGNSEKWFIVISSFIFCTVFLGVSGSDVDHVSEYAAFWAFFTFNIAIYSYFGQFFVCVVPSMATAQILASVFIGLNNFFSGLIVRPQFLGGFFNVPFWITPGHYVYEGMIVSLFTADKREVVAVKGSAFYEALGCDESTGVGSCVGTVSQYVYSFFGGRYTSDHIMENALILGAYLVMARVLTFLALNYIEFSAT